MASIFLTSKVLKYPLLFSAYAGIFSSFKTLAMLSPIFERTNITISLYFKSLPPSTFRSFFNSLILFAIALASSSISEVSFSILPTSVSITSLIYSFLPSSRFAPRYSAASSSYSIPPISSFIIFLNIALAPSSTFFLLLKFLLRITFFASSLSAPSKLLKFLYFFIKSFGEACRNPYIDCFTSPTIKILFFSIAITMASCK